MVPPTRGSMPNQGPRSEYVHCNNNMLANPNAMQVPCFGTLSGTTVSKATDHGSQSGVTAPNSHDSRAMANRPAPLQAGARSKGRDFIGGEGIQLDSEAVMLNR